MPDEPAPQLTIEEVRARLRRGASLADSLLSGLDLRGMSLRGVSLTGTRITQCDFSDVDL